MANDLLRISRRVHLYFGLLIAPSLLFFALTGAAQMLSLHEGAPGSPYKAPAWLASLAQLHKKATLAVNKRPDGPPQKEKAAAEGRVPGATPQQGGPPQVGQGQAAAPITLAGKQKQHLPMKIFFLIVSLGLVLSTLTGVYMTYRYERNAVVVSAWLLAGVVVPVVLTRF